MEALGKALKEFRELQMPHQETSGLPDYAEHLRDAASEWAKACLGTFRDDLLKKGLGVSAAIADFLAELEASK